MGVVNGAFHLTKKMVADKKAKLNKRIVLLLFINSFSKKYRSLHEPFQ
jgi:hypothetical protein